MNLENSVVLVDNVSAWSKATVVWSGSTLQVLVANPGGGAVVAETFHNVDRHSSAGGGKQVFTSSTGIADSDGDLFANITVIPLGGCRPCGR